MILSLKSATPIYVIIIDAIIMGSPFVTSLRTCYIIMDFLLHCRELHRILEIVTAMNLVNET